MVGVVTQGKSATAAKQAPPIHPRPTSQPSPLPHFTHPPPLSSWVCPSLSLGHFQRHRPLPHLWILSWNSALVVNLVNRKCATLFKMHWVVKMLPSKMWLYFFFKYCKVAKCTGFRMRQSGFQPCPQLTSCVTLNKILNLTVAQLLYLKNRT